MHKLFGLIALTAMSCCLTSRACAADLAVLTLVDGAQMRGQILFKHPNCDRLVIRSPGGATIQSVDLAVVHTVEADGKTQTHHPRRPLTDAESKQRDRDGLWGDEAGPGQLGRYAGQAWEDRPVMVWREPGKSGDAMRPENWLDASGRPYADGPWQRTRGDEGGLFDGDVLLPAADKPYQVLQAGKRDHLDAYQMRHLTVERNGSYRVRYTVAGNLWMKDGGMLGQGTQTGGLGSGDANRHTFARFCNYHDEPPDPQLAPAGTRWAYAPVISHWVRIDTGDSGSLEIIGCSGGPSDRLTVRRGTLIVAEDSSIGNGPRGSFFNAPGTTVILLDGAKVGSPVALSSNNRATYGIGGTLMFGAADHPLTRDLVFSATPFPADQIQPDASPADRTSGASLVLGAQGRMIVHSSDPTRARVIFRPRSTQLPVSQYSVDKEYWQFIDRRGDTYYPPKPELWRQPQVPTRIAAVFRGETDFNGVVFEGFHEAGIVVRPDDRRRWRNVSFEQNADANPERLFRDLDR